MEEVVEIEEVSLEEYLEGKEEIMLKEVKVEQVSRVGVNPKAKREEFSNGRKAKFLEKTLHLMFSKATKEMREKPER